MQWMSVANYCPVIICNQIVLAAIDVLILWITGLATIFKFKELLVSVHKSSSRFH